MAEAALEAVPEVTDNQLAAEGTFDQVPLKVDAYGKTQVLHIACS